jgi:peptidoglycan/xylan/chitin deacetylase (PgdA/CDA1 family)
VALTFDLCPTARGTGFDEALVALLERERIPATFFLSGRWIETHAESTWRLLANPSFEIGTHGQRHVHLRTLDALGQRAEIGDAVHVVETRFGQYPSLFRPPYGEWTDTTLAVAHALGQQTVLWSVVSGDPDPHGSAQRVLSTVAMKLTPGAIVVFHANGHGVGTREAVEALHDDVLPRRGLRPVTVSVLLRGCSDGQR